MLVTDHDLTALARKLISLAAESGPRDMALRRARVEATLQTFSRGAVGDVEEAFAKAFHEAAQEGFAK
ncbi:hypothetical protein [Hyphomicrobium sp. DY-1]|uniref:hypothetical protein n=1 Tax=Hyphomicrobium sp. DY-1 TaxID=3075650 RepID=UPI0039C05D58